MENNKYWICDYFKEIVRITDNMGKLAEELDKSIDRIRDKINELAVQAENEYINYEEIINHQEYLNSFTKK